MPTRTPKEWHTMFLQFDRLCGDYPLDRLKEHLTEFAEAVRKEALEEGRILGLKDALFCARGWDFGKPIVDDILVLIGNGAGGSDDEASEY